MNNTILSIIHSTCVPLLLLAGCGAPQKASFRLQERRISIFTEPSGATVFQLLPLETTAKELGTTPLVNQTVVVMTDISFQDVSFTDAQMIFEHQDKISIRIDKPGYESHHATIKTRSELVEQKFYLKPLTDN